MNPDQNPYLMQSAGKYVTSAIEGVSITVKNMLFVQDDMQWAYEGCMCACDFLLSWRQALEGIVMTIKTYFTVISIIGMVFGVGFLLAPEQLGLFYGMKESPDMAFSQRLFGGSLLAWALVGWFARDFSDVLALRGVLMASIVGHVAGVVVAVSGTLSGFMSAVGWLAVFAYLFGAVGAVYFLMTGPAPAEP
jgi:hypothetical protein